MKRLYSYLILLTIYGCQFNDNLIETSNIESGECPEEPEVRLFEKNLREIDLSDEFIDEAVARSNKTLGYIFQGEKEQKLKYKTEQDICLWVYTPDGDILNSSILPKTGKYIIQVSTTEASLPFKLSLSLEQNKTNEDYSWLSKRKVTEADLLNKSAWTLDIMRNEIFARHGRRFKSLELQNYFNQQSWYRPLYLPNEFPVSLLSPLEKENAKVILEYQNRNNLKYIQ